MCHEGSICFIRVPGTQQTSGLIPVCKLSHLQRPRSTTVQTCSICFLPFPQMLKSWTSSTPLALINKLGKGFDYLYLIFTLRVLKDSAQMYCPGCIYFSRDKQVKYPRPQNSFLCFRTHKCWVYYTLVPPPSRISYMWRNGGPNVSMPMCGRALTNTQASCSPHTQAGLFSRILYHPKSHTVRKSPGSEFYRVICWYKKICGVISEQTLQGFYRTGCSLSCSTSLWARSKLSHLLH